MRKYLIVGLGNIGEKYQNTRHNIGFDVVDEMARVGGFSFVKANFGEVCQFKFRGRPVTLLKPDTFMNLSGNAVRYWMKKEKIDIENIFIITDDLNLTFGAIRIRGKGSDGGHNGLKHIQSVLNTTHYPRLRFGIGDSFEQGRQVDYVLSPWTDEQKLIVKDRIEWCSEAAYAFIFKGLTTAMNEFNRKS